jgi:hypothetical protein
MKYRITVHREVIMEEIYELEADEPDHAVAAVMDFDEEPVSREELYHPTGQVELDDVEEIYE